MPCIDFVNPLTLAWLVIGVVCSIGLVYCAYRGGVFDRDEFEGIIPEAAASTVTSIRIIALAAVAMLVWPLVMILFGIHVVRACRSSVHKRERDSMENW
jgi:hypothetical protein